MQRKTGVRQKSQVHRTHKTSSALPSASQGKQLARQSECGTAAASEKNSKATSTCPVPKRNLERLLGRYLLLLGGIMLLSLAQKGTMHIKCAHLLAAVKGSTEGQLCTNAYKYPLQIEMEPISQVRSPKGVSTHGRDSWFPCSPYSE